MLRVAALLPGISRSGITMVGGLWRSLSHEDAARFAFLLATPVILGAGVLKQPSLAGSLGNTPGRRRPRDPRHHRIPLRPLPGPQLRDPQRDAVRDTASSSGSSASCISRNTTATPKSHAVQHGRCGQAAAYDGITAADGRLNIRSAMLLYMAHGHRQLDPSDLDADFARAVADTMQALATPSRLHILGRLHAGPCSVNDLADAASMEPSAVSHQLRLLRHLGLVVGRRQGRHVIYELHDDHVGQLLEQAIGHVEHLRQGLSRSTVEVDVAQA
jgi:DNA-binding transcriptional ArsR family regulator